VPAGKFLIGSVQMGNRVVSPPGKDSVITAAATRMIIDADIRWKAAGSRDGAR